CHDCNHATTGAINRGGRRRESLSAARAEDDTRTLCCQGPCRREAESPARTRDDGHLVLQLEIHGAHRTASRYDRGMFRRLFVIAVMASALAGCGREEAPLPPITPPLDVAAPPPDASVTASGLASKVLEPGDSNVRPTAASTVRVNYTGWTTAGEMFDSSIPRGEPVEFQVGGVIPGWTEGLQLMVVGEKRRFWIPADLA